MRSIRHALLCALAMMAVVISIASLAQAADHADSARQTMIRGVRRRDLPRYQATSFTCQTPAGPITLTHNQINDDYCDCTLDGADEPGTSACAHLIPTATDETAPGVTRFFCANKGAKARLLPLSRVDDGVCDCCDGSDEDPSRFGAVCPNSCEEAGRAVRQAMEAELAAHENGAIKKAQLIQAALTKRQELEAKKTKYDELLAKRRQLFEEAKAKKEEQEELERIEKEKRGVGASAQQQLESMLKEAGALSDQPTEASSTKPGETPSTDGAGTDSEKPAENFPYPAEYAYKAADENDAAAAAAEALAASQPAQTEGKGEENFPYPAEYAYNPNGGEGSTSAPTQQPTLTDQQQEAMEDAQYKDEDEDDLIQPLQSQDATYVHQGAEDARAAFSQIESKLQRLEKKYQALSEDLSKDYGPNQVLMHMDGQCYEIQVKQYTYEVCPFNKASQKENGIPTSLGSWSGVEVTPAGGESQTGSLVGFKFSGGATCWQGPQRSLRVKLECGVDESILSVDEPSKCVYEMKMQTPALCDEKHATILRINLEGGGDIMEEEEGEIAEA